VGKVYSSRREAPETARPICMVTLLGKNLRNGAGLYAVLTAGLIAQTDCQRNVENGGLHHTSMIWPNTARY